MGTTILKILIQEVISRVVSAISDYFKWKKIAKENKDEAKEITREKDPVKRAQRMRDFLNS